MKNFSAVRVETVSDSNSLLFMLGVAAVCVGRYFIHVWDALISGLEQEYIQQAVNTDAGNPNPHLVFISPSSPDLRIVLHQHVSGSRAQTCHIYARVG